MFKNNPYIIMMRLYWRFVPSKKRAVLFMVLAGLDRMTALVAPYLLGKMLTIAQIGGPDMWQSLWPYATLTMIIPLAEWAFHGPSRIIEEKLSFDVTRVYKLHLYHMAISLPLERHTDNHSGETIDKLYKASDALNGFSSNIYSSFGTFLSFFGALMALIVIRPTTTIVMLIMFVGMAFLLKQFDIKIVAWMKEEQKLSHKVSALLFDYLSNIRTLITLRFLHPTEVVVGDAIQKQRIPFVKHTTRNEWKWFVTDGTLQTVTSAIVIIYIYVQWKATGVVMLGVLSMIAQYVNRLSSSFYNITNTYSRMMRYSANVSAVEGLESDYKKYMESQVVCPSIGVWDDIEIKDLHFTYKDQQKKSHTLHDTHMHIHLGEKIAVVGESGSGKSTFLTLLRGLYDVDSVNLAIDNKPYDTLHVLSNNTSLIPQEPEIFEDSMRYNISMGSEVSQDDIERYARMACFHDIALSLPNGYEASIKEKGVNLSGGQKQRLALARGLMAAQDSDILLLDESTSSVDSVNEKKIYQNIFISFPEKTIIAAIHKLHLLPMFDMIYVFDQGTIVASGTFDELIKQDGNFARMWEEYSVDMKGDSEEE